jgi:hypothetical protein
MIDNGSIYAKLMDEDLADLEAIYNHSELKAARRRRLANSAEETDYVAWEAGFKSALNRHDAVVREWATTHG